MGLQIPHYLHSEVSEEGALSGAATRTGKGFSGAYGATRSPDCGRALDAGSRPYVDLDPAEVLGLAGHGVYHGEECDPHRTGVCRTE